MPNLSIMYFITEPDTPPNPTARKPLKIRKITSLYFNNHFIINSNNLDLDFYIHFTVSIKVI